MSIRTPPASAPKWNTSGAHDFSVAPERQTLVAPQEPVVHTGVLGTPKPEILGIPAQCDQTVTSEGRFNKPYQSVKGLPIYWALSKDSRRTGVPGSSGPGYEQSYPPFQWISCHARHPHRGGCDTGKTKDGGAIIPVEMWIINGRK